MALPQYIELDPRICFSIFYFKTEAEADEYHKYIRKQGYTYNGGFYHGRPCGRDISWDKEVDGKKRYAVTG